MYYLKHNIKDNMSTNILGAGHWHFTQAYKKAPKVDQNRQGTNSNPILRRTVFSI